jgi:hypothetical protein
MVTIILKSRYPLCALFASATLSILGCGGPVPAEPPMPTPTPAPSSQIVADFRVPIDPPLIKDKFGVYQTPLGTQATVLASSPLLSEAQVRDLRYEVGIGKSGVIAYDQVGGTSSNPIYDFTSIDALVGSWSSVHVFPLLAFTYCPLPLQTDGNWEDVPSNFATWENINQAYASHFESVDQLPGVWFEQWNEPDLNLNGKVFFLGDQSDYGNLYASGSAGIRRGSQDARVGGPAVAGDTSYLTSSGMLNDPIDFASIHAYANYSSQLSNLRNALPVLPGLPLLLTEYASYTSFGDASPNSRYPAAAAFFNDIGGLLSNTDTPKVYWAQWIDDSAGGGVGMLTADLHRKALYNALKIYQSLLPADRFNVNSSNAAGVGSLAAADPDNAALVLWNNNSSAASVMVTLNNLPFISGTASLYYIDSSHASYLDGGPEQLAVAQTWQVTSNSTTWTGIIQPQGTAFILVSDGVKASDGMTQKSLLNYNSIGTFVRSNYWFWTRPPAGSAYSDFDPYTSIARVGMGNANDFDVAQIGNVYDHPVNELSVAVTMSGPFAAEDENSIFGLRFDFQNANGIYDYSVLYTNGLYNPTRGSTLPWGEGTAVPDRVITVNTMGTVPFSLSLSSIAPTDWNGTRVIITPILQNAGKGSRATIVITPATSAGGSSLVQ